MPFPPTIAYALGNTALLTLLLGHSKGIFYYFGINAARSDVRSKSPNMVVLGQSTSQPHGR